MTEEDIANVETNGDSSDKQGNFDHSFWKDRSVEWILFHFEAQKLSEISDKPCYPNNL